MAYLVATHPTDTEAPAGLEASRPESHLALNRRDLILGGGALAAALCAQSLSAQSLSAQSLRAAGSAASEPLAAAPELPMSLGFIEGTESIADLKSWGRLVARGIPPTPSHTHLQVVPAEELLVGDPFLAGGTARLRIHGLFPEGTPGIERLVGSVHATVYFPAENPFRDRPHPFFAWSFLTQPGSQPSQDLSFAVPVGFDGSLKLMLEVELPPATRELTRRGVLGGSRGSFRQCRLTTDFTVDRYAGRPRLQRGLYLLGFTSETWRAEHTLALEGRQLPELASLVIGIESIPEGEGGADGRSEALTSG